jgi:sortase A
MDGVVRRAIRAAGEVLLTVGLVGLLFIGYLIWGTGLRAASAQRALAGELNQQWQRPGGTHRVIVTGVLVAAKPR